MRSDAVAGPAPTRSELVPQAIEQWSSETSALGGRDPLLAYRDLKVGTLDLAAAEPEARKALLAGERVVISKLFPHEPLRSSALRSVHAIRDKDRELTEERGLPVCFLAVGVATWSNPFAARRPTAPVMLRSATVVARDPAETDFVVTIADDAFVNPMLLHAVDTQLGLRFDADDLRDPAGRLRYATVVERLREFAPPHVVDGFSIAHRAVLATFTTAPLAMTRDLATFGVDLQHHGVVSALAGDSPSVAAISRPGTAVTPRFRVLDTDAEQDAVIAAVAGSGHLRVRGAPGTGRTQTTAALVAEMVGQGQRVLVIGQKRASLDGLIERLGSAGLSDLVLDTGRPQPAESADQITETARRLDAEAPVDDSRDPADEAVAGTADLAAGQLDAYRDAVHQLRQPWGTSAYEAMTHVATAPARARSSARIDATVLAEGDSTDAVRARLREYADLEGLTLTSDTSPWYGAAVTSESDGAELMATVTQLRRHSLPNLRDTATRSAVEVGLTGPETVADCLAIVDLLASVAATVERAGPEIWDQPLDDLAVASGDRDYRAQASTGHGFFARRKLRRRLAELTGLSARQDRRRMHEVVLAARDQLAAWRQRARDSGNPRTGQHLSGAIEAADTVRREIAVLTHGHARTSDLPDLPVGAAAKRLDELMADEAHLRALPRLYALQEELSVAGLDELLAEMRKDGTDPEQAEEVFDYVWHSSLLDHWRGTDPVLRDFDREKHESLVDDFRARDVADMRTAAERVLRARHRNFSAVAAEHEGQTAVLTGSTGPGAPANPRELLELAPDVVLSAVPCWVTSPLTVNESVPAQRLFDVVVVEDAGRIAVAEAVPAIARGTRLVLMGDDDVARPTFSTAVEPAPDPDEQEGPWAQDPPASVVDLLRGVLPERTLTEQYRVRDHRLVGFAAETAYAGRMTTIPSVGGGGRLSMDVVEASPESDDPVDSSSAEVDRVVELVLEHVRTRPHESLGVVTLGPRHAERLDSAVRRALIRSPEVTGYLRGDRAEPFFVKDVEQVSGDVRDAVILSLGYGRSVDGRILYRFGALGRPGGERRLTAAVTCARERMTVVATFGADDLSQRRLTSPGARALGQFLSYVQHDTAPTPSGDDTGTQTGSDPDHMPADADSLVHAVADRLRDAGIEGSVEIGHGGPGGVTLAVRHPSRSGRFVLAVETDGPAYAARPSTRERERLRFVRLRRLGWNVHRVWSAAWAADPDGETERLVAAYEQAVADADAYDWAVAAVEADVIADVPADETGAEGDSAADDADATTAHSPGDSAGTESESDPATSDAVTASGERLRRYGDRPPLVGGHSVSDYTGRELAALARWVESDAVARPEDEVVDLVTAELGLAFDDARTVDVLRHAVQVGRAGSPV